MKDISERVSYLQGLSEGLNIREGTPHGKIIAGMLGVLEELAEEVVFIQNELENYKEYVESIDDDLLDVEEIVLNPNGNGSFIDEEDFVEFDCSHCGESLYFDASLMEDDDAIEIICPNCNEVVFINDGSFDFEHANMDFILDEEMPENPSPS